MATCEYIPNISLWNPRPLPAHDYELLRLLGITYHDLVFTDYKLVWNIIDKHKLNAKKVQRIKHIRKREKNKLFARRQFHALDDDIQNLKQEKEELLKVRVKIEEDCCYWREMCQQSMTFHFANTDPFRFTSC